MLSENIIEFKFYFQLWSAGAPTTDGFWRGYHNFFGIRIGPICGKRAKNTVQVFLKQLRRPQ